MSPFIIYALPRSRTAWLAEFLTYGPWTCFHERAVTMRSLKDVRAFFSQPHMGTVETGVSPGWPLINALVPNIRTVAIHRPVDDVVKSIKEIDVSSFATYDYEKLRRNLTHMSRCLKRISDLPGVLSVEFSGLESEATCKAIFTHCLPYHFDRPWWDFMKDQNVQIDVPEHVRYCLAHKTEIEKFKRECKSHLRALAQRRVHHG